MIPIANTLGQFDGRLGAEHTAGRCHSPLATPAFLLRTALASTVTAMEAEQIYHIHPEIEHFMKGVTNEEFVTRRS